MKMPNRNQKPKSSNKTVTEFTALWAAMSENSDNNRILENRIIALETINAKHAANVREHLEKRSADRVSEVIARAASNWRH
jgi:hypothetical protein